MLAVTFPLDTFLQAAAMLYPDRDDLLQRLAGVTIERLGDLALGCPMVNERWKPSPAGYSRQPHHLSMWLSTQSRAIYSAVGNDIIKHPGCHRMVEHLLRELHADDPVVLVDTRLALGFRVLTGEFDAVTPDALRGRVDYRKANVLDVSNIFERVVRPQWLAMYERRS